MQEKKVDFEKYDVVIGYGIGQNYEQAKHRLRKIVNLNYLADMRWEKSDLETYDSIPVIHLRQIRGLKKTLVILFPESTSVRDVVARELKDTKTDICNIQDIMLLEHVVKSQELINLLPKTEYWDDYDNHIVFDKTIPANIVIHFYGKENFLKIGNNISAGKLELFFGNDGRCMLGDNLSIQQAVCRISQATFKIGEGCMLSNGIVVMTHDEHHIFDCMTHERINFARDVIIEDQVWVGYRVTLLGGTRIGTGSIVGTGAVTSSGFKDHVVLAGCPARIVRENVCWSKDSTWYFNRNSLDECVDQNTLKYM